MKHTTLTALLLLALLPSCALAKGAKVHTIRNARITFYCGAPNDDPSHRTKSGRPWSANGVAAGPDVPMGSRLRIEGYPQIFVVDDRGGAIGPGEIDVRRHTRRCTCARLGVQRRTVRYTRPKAKARKGGRR